MSKNYIGFTMDLRKLVSVLAQDPTCRAEIVAGLQGPKEPLTTALGAANFGTQEQPLWHSLFPATVEGRNSGEEGLFYRNNSYDGKGDRIQMRLRLQEAKPQPQPAQTQYQLGSPTAAETQAAIASIQQSNPEGFAQLLAAIGQSQGAGQLAASQEVNTPAPAAAPGPAIPADIAAILNSAG
jgi:hypothetical protein